MNNPISTFYSNLNENYMYAPGIATYGISGKPGENGKDGNAVYYSNIPFTEIYITDILSRLTNNELMTLANVHEKNIKGYIKGDIFISADGYFWELIIDIANIPETTLYSNSISNIFKKIGKIDLSVLTELNNTQDSMFAISESGLHIYNAKGNGLILFGNYLGSNDEITQRGLVNSDSVLNIINSVSSDSYMSDLLTLTSVNQSGSIFLKNSLNVYYSDLDEAFHIQSDNPILFDVSNFRLKPSENTNLKDQYTQLNVYQNSITNFYIAFKDSTWDVSDGTLYLYNYKGDVPIDNIYVKVTCNLNEKLEDYIYGPFKYSYHNMTDQKLTISKNINYDIKTVSVFKNIEVYIPKKSS